MTIIRGGLIGAIGSAGTGGGGNTQLALSDGLACYATAFSGVSTTTFAHNLGTVDIAVEFHDTAGNLLVPNNWQIINPNVLDVDFGSVKSGRVVIIGCIASGLSPITGGVTLLEGLSGIIDLDSPDGSIDISVSGQVIQLTTTGGGGGGGSGTVSKAAMDFTPASGYAFVIYHGLNTTDFTFNMWNTEIVPRELMTPQNVYPSGFNHAVITLDVPASGRIVLTG